jgi:GNAT superfamily N-acetyltransferase
MDRSELTSRQPLAIRAAATSEDDVLTDLAHESKRHWGYSQRDIELWSSQLSVSPSFIEKNTVFVAVKGDTIVGFYALVREGAAAELEHFWVHPRCIGTGLGRTMFRHALEAARAEGAARIKVVSDPNAEGFYLRMGARRAGEEPSTPQGRMLPVLVLELK